MVRPLGPVRYAPVTTSAGRTGVNREMPGDLPSIMGLTASRTGLTQKIEETL